MKNKEIIVFSAYAPSLNHGGGIATLSSLKVYSRIYKHIHYVYFGKSNIELPKDISKQKVTFYIINMDYKKKWIRFLLSFLYRVPAVCVSFQSKYIISSINAVIDEVLLKHANSHDDEYDVIFEDLPVACILPMLKNKYPKWKYAIRSHNVLTNIFQSFITNVSNYSFIFKSIMKLENYKHYLYEKRIISIANKVWAISEDDQAEYIKIFNRCDGVFSVSYNNPEFLNILSENPYAILYLGGIDLRKKSGMESFVNISWKAIKAKFPKAKLLLGGRNTQAFSDESNDVYGYGFIESEVEFLGKGLIFINTQTVGSGVKLKSIVSVIAGKLLISTKIGIEGVCGENGKHYLVAKDWEEFAQMVIDSLKDLECSYKIAKSGQSYFKKCYSFDKLYQAASVLILNL